MSNERKAIILEKMIQKNIDLMVFVPGSNLHYITGNQFGPSERLLLYFLKQNGQGYYIVPEVERTKLNVSENDQVFSYADEDGPQVFVDTLKDKLNISGQTSVEVNDMRLFEWHYLNRLGISKPVNSSDLIKDIRIIKSNEEIKRMRRATQVLEQSLHATMPTIKVGKSEMEIAARLEYEMKMRGSQGTPFTTIVGSGYRGALSHGRASEKVIEDGDLIVIDFGSIIDGYVGDMTRTIGVGNVSDEKRNVYDIVKNAIGQSIQAIEIGMKACDIDAVARKVISDAGYSENFTHRLGHGIGLDAHEEPYIASSNKDTLQPGMSFTIEPGIYIENQFGIRIEDNIIITEDDIENLMTMNHDLIIL